MSWILAKNSSKDIALAGSDSNMPANMGVKRSLSPLKKKRQSYKEIKWLFYKCGSILTVTDGSVLEVYHSIQCLLLHSFGPLISFQIFSLMLLGACEKYHLIAISKSNCYQLRSC